MRGSRTRCDASMWMDGDVQKKAIDPSGRDASVLAYLVGLLYHPAVRSIDQDEGFYTTAARLA